MTLAKKTLSLESSEILLSLAALPFRAALALGFFFLLKHFGLLFFFFFFFSFCFFFLF